MGELIASFNLGTWQIAPRAIAGEGDIKIAGSAVFRDDKLVGWLNELETRGVQWITGQVQGGAVVTTCPKDPERLKVFGINNARRRIKAELTDDAIIFRVKVSTEGYLAEYYGGEEILDAAFIEGLNHNVADSIEEEIRRALRKAQELKADVFNFYEILYRSHPRFVQENIPTPRDWDEIFPYVDFEVEVIANTRRIGTSR